MGKDEFNNFWSNIFVPEIKFVISRGNRGDKLCSDERLNSLKQLTKQKYDEQSNEIKQYFQDDEPDRHKIAASLYVAFVEAAKSLPLIEIKGNTELFQGIQEFFAHRVAFYVSLYVLQSYIKEENSEFSKKFMQKGFSEPPELICEDGKRNYYDHTICQLWLAARSRSLSALQLSNVLYSIESIFREKYKH